MDPLPLARQLVAIPSINPMGAAVDGPEYFEQAVTDWLVERLSGWGAVVEVDAVAPRRANVLARCDCPGARRTLLWEAHQDTVPVDGMTIPPFAADVRDGRLYGRGACDVKGGLAAMLAAFGRLLHERPRGAASVLLACTCDEEATQLGARRLAALWTTARGASRLLCEPPAGAIVAEPTGLAPLVAHRGVTRWKLRTRGRACHSSDPTQGTNAIYRMARVLVALEEYAHVLPLRSPPHPLCGPATLSVGVIRGGQSVNIVPADCEIEIDRRTIPGEEPLRVIAPLLEFLRNHVDFDVSVDEPWIAAPALSDANNGPLADELIRAVQDVTGRLCRPAGAPYGTDAAVYAAAGTPAVVFGPGSIAQAHTADEWLPIDELEQAAEVLFRLACAG